MCFCYLNHHFVTAVKLVGNLFLMYVITRVFSNCFDVLNPNIKSFLLLIEWKIIKHRIISVFVV